MQTHQETLHSHSNFEVESLLLKIRKIEIEGYKSEFNLAREILHHKDVLERKDKEIQVLKEQLNFLTGIWPVRFTARFYIARNYLIRLFIALSNIPAIIKTRGGVLPVSQELFNSFLFQGIRHSLYRIKNQLSTSLRNSKYNQTLDTLLQILDKIKHSLSGKTSQ